MENEEKPQEKLPRTLEAFGQCLRDFRTKLTGCGIGLGIDDVVDAWEKLCSAQPEAGTFRMPASLIVDELERTMGGILVTSFPGPQLLAHTGTSAVIVPCLVRYRKTWGCPDGGEVGCLVTCTSNPTFDKDLDDWTWRVIEIARRTKKALQQTTLAISFSNGTHVYLKGAESVVHADEKRFEFDDSQPFDGDQVCLA